MISAAGKCISKTPFAKVANLIPYCKMETTTRNKLKAYRCSKIICYLIYLKGMEEEAWLDNWIHRELNTAHNGNRSQIQAGKVIRQESLLLLRILCVHIDRKILKGLDLDSNWNI